MKLLLKLTLKNRRIYFLLVLAVIAMCSLTIATSLEMFALGAIAKKGPDFFEVFAGEKNGAAKSDHTVTKENLIKTWDQIDNTDKGYVTPSEVTQYMANKSQKGFIERTMAYINRSIPITGNVTNLAIMIFIIALFKAFALFGQRFSTKLVAIKISRDLRQNYFEHIQSLPMNFYQQYNIGSLSSRVVGDAGMIAESLNSSLTNYIQAPFTIISSLTLCFLTSWQLSLIIFFGFPLILFPILFIARRIKKISKQIQKNQEGFANVLIEFLTGIQTVKVFAMEEFSLKKYREHNQRMCALERKSARYDVSTRPLVHTIGMSFLATTMLTGIYVLQLSLADVFFFCGILYMFYEPIKKFAEENNHIQRGIAAAERMDEVLSLQPQIEDRVDAIKLETLQSTIEFDRVWFRYGDEWILQDVSFTVNKGETVAIVGPTGAGKSTIVQLLPRLYEVQRGEIRIDGKPLNAYTQKSLRENIAFVPQKPFLFLDTIAENISFGRPFTQEEIEAAAHKAHANEFIQNLPLKYATLLNETGKNLSGGQQQRLAIARALIKTAPILVMDEATSALDSVSENQIKIALKELHGEITQVIIAHRLSTIEHADKIIYIDKGKKTHEGTKDDLLESCKGFRLMWEMLQIS